MPGGDKGRKAGIFDRLEKYLLTYSRILLVDVDNVSSNQFHQIRIKLRGKAIILMGKNTMIRRKVRNLMGDHPDLEKLLMYLKGNIGLCFTNEEDLPALRTMIEEDRVKAPAKTGAVAPLDVFIEAQNTGMGPEKTSFFQALGIATKITKGTIEILNRVHLIKENDRVGASAATLLNMLNVSPFTYGMKCRAIYDAGTVFEPEILDITSDELVGYLLKGVSNIASISLATGIPTMVAVPHLLIQGFKNMLKISLATDYTFKEAAELKELLSDPSKLAAAAAAASATSAPAGGAAEKKEEKKEEPEEEEDEDMGFGLFD